MKRTYRFIVSIIVVLIALSSFLVGKGFLEIFTSRKFDSWLSDQPQFYTSQMSDETKETFVSVVRSYAQTHKMILITKKTESITEGPRILTVGVSYVSKSGVRLFPYYLLTYIMPPLYKR